MSRLMDSQSAGVRNARPTGSGFLRLLAESPPTTQGLSLGSGSQQNNWAHLVSAVDSGAAVMLSRTSDGGAISLTLYLGTERYREYASTPEQLDALCEALGRKAQGL
jgi:hypothetical protein